MTKRIMNGRSQTHIHAIRRLKLIESEGWADVSSLNLFFEYFSYLVHSTHKNTVNCHVFFNQIHEFSKCDPNFIQFWESWCPIKGFYTTNSTINWKISIVSSPIYWNQSKCSNCC